jgi:hypothetical protein
VFMHASTLSFSLSIHTHTHTHTYIYISLSRLFPHVDGIPHLSATAACLYLYIHTYMTHIVIYFIRHASTHMPTILVCGDFPRLFRMFCHGLMHVSVSMLGYVNSLECLTRFKQTQRECVLYVSSKHKESVFCTFQANTKRVCLIRFKQTQRIDVSA